MEPGLIVIGASLGGTDALKVVLAALPRDLALPVVVVQHRGRDEDEALARALSEVSALPVCEPEDKEALCAGRVYLAPADYHLLVEPGALALSTDAPVNFSRPSIDVLFESAADTYGDATLAVVLTGASTDGALGAATIAARGGLVIVQDPATARASAMPEGAQASAGAGRVVPLSEIAPLLARLCAEREARPRDERPTTRGSPD